MKAAGVPSGVEGEPSTTTEGSGSLTTPASMATAEELAPTAAGSQMQPSISNDTTARRGGKTNASKMVPSDTSTTAR